MDAIINKFYKLGIITNDALNQYFDNILKTDNQIKHMLDSLGIVRNVNKFDRDFYKTWVTEWQMPDELINYAIELSKDKFNPMQYLNKLLSLWHTNNVKDIDDCKKYVIEEKLQVKPSKQTRNYKNRDYSKTDLNALFDNLEEVEL